MVTKFGIEIETFANKHTLYGKAGAPKIFVYRYHRGEVGTMEQLPSWKFETDSSINPGEVFKYIEKETFEAISKKFRLKEWDKVFGELKHYFTQGKKIELDEVLAFNETCGCHVHFSSTTNSHKTFLTYKKLKLIRNRMDNYLKENYPHIYDKYAKQYFRPQSEKVDGDIVDYENRRVEFNMCGLKDNRGIEWRAFNLLGVTKWSELYDIVRSALSIIDQTIKEHEKEGRKEEVEITVPKKKIREIYDLVTL